MFHVSILHEKSVGTTELHYSKKKRYHVLDILVCLPLFRAVVKSLYYILVKHLL